MNEATDPITDDLDIQSQFNAIAEKADVEGGEQYTFGFDELLGIADEEQLFLVPELIPAHSVAVMIGEDGIGKTQLMTQLCLQIATGQQTFLTQPLITEHKAALIVATEDSRRKFIKAAAKQWRHLTPGVKSTDVRLRFTEGDNFDDLQSLVAEIIRMITLQPVDLIVLDALSDLFTMIDGEVNSNKDARGILGILQKLCNKYSTTIILIHHAAKTKMVEKRKVGKMFVIKEDSQGAGAISQKARTMLALTHDGKTIVNGGKNYKNLLHVVKANEMSKHFVTQALELDFDGVNLVHSYSRLVDIEQYEAGDTTGAEQPFSEPPKDDRTTKDIYKQTLDTIFAIGYTMKRGELCDAIAKAMGVGLNKVNAGVGVFNEMVSLGLLEKDGKLWAYTVKKPAPQPEVGYFGEGDPGPANTSTTQTTDDDVPF